MSAARDRILETADRLFYAEGVRSVGVDRVIAEAGVAKMTLYNHFKSKDELIRAVLEFREAKFLEWFEAGLSRRQARGTAPLRALFATLEEWFKSDGFRGCAFINATAELADREHPGSRFAADHKRALHATVAELVVQQGGETARGHAEAVALLLEGAIVMAQITGSARPARTARDAAVRLVESGPAA